MSANEQRAAAESLGFVPYTRPTGTDTAEPLKIGVLISGSGTNLQALIDLIAAGKLNASIELVVSSRPSAKGLQRAERAGIQTLTLSKDVYAAAGGVSQPRGQLASGTAAELYRCACD